MLSVSLFFGDLSGNGYLGDAEGFGASAERQILVICRETDTQATVKVLERRQSVRNWRVGLLMHKIRNFHYHILISLVVSCLLLTACGSAQQQDTQPQNSQQQDEQQTPEQQETEKDTKQKEAKYKDIAQVPVSLSGGSGKASVESPCAIFEEDGKLYAKILWSSNHYDYMVVDGQRIEPVSTDERSVFDVPLPEDARTFFTQASEGAEQGTYILPVQADTTAMSTPHLIEYELVFERPEGQNSAAAEDAAPLESGDSSGSLQEDSLEFGDSSGSLHEDSLESGDSSGSLQEDSLEPGDGSASLQEDPQVTDVTERDSDALTTPPVLEGLQYLSTDKNEYAKCFALHRYEGGVKLLCTDDGRRYLFAGKADTDSDKLSDENNSAEASRADMIVIQAPPEHIYLAATAVMSHFDAVGAVPSIALSSIRREDWYIDAAREAMENGEILYGGKYSAPDYEKMVSIGVDLAIESSMILHTPKVQEKIEQLGIPVLIDRSSYEPEPLGRAEWVKVYGALTGREAEAQQAFEEQKNAAASLNADTGRSAAVFSINSTKQIVTRKPGDYMARMVEEAGGTFLTPGGTAPGQETAGQESSGQAAPDRAASGETASDQAASGTQTVSMESFFEATSQADVLIYNAAIEDAPVSVEELARQYTLLKECKAYTEGNIWCTKGSLYQSVGETGWIIRDINMILTGSGEPAFFVKLE